MVYSVLLEGGQDRAAVQPVINISSLSHRGNAQINMKISFAARAESIDLVI